MPTLDFKGKQFVYAHHLTVPFRQLNIDAKKSLPKDGKASVDDNLIIHGDNLHALKALLPVYAGKVDCIFIDPPYNTGNEGWCYNDNVNAPLMREWLKDSANPVDKEDLERHDKWLCMMWPRLALLRELLADSGVLFVTIDHNEQHRLREILDELFGEDCFIASIAWQKRTSPEARKKLGPAHDTIHVYSKRPNSTSLSKLQLSEEQINEFANPDNDPKGDWTSTDLTAQNIDPSKRRDQQYKIELPTGEKVSPPPGRCWSMLEPEFLKKKAEGRIWFGAKGNARPRIKTYLEESEGVSSWTWWPNEEVGHNQEAKKEILQILGPENPFDYPKPVRLLTRIVELSTGKDSIILDSFAGSGTTAHAVLAMNKRDKGNRKFILVETEDYAHKLTAERVRRVIKGVKDAKDDDLKKGLSGSFTFCELGEEINIENLLKGEKLPSYDELARYAFYTATGQTLEKVKHGADFLVGETLNYRVHVIYQPDTHFLRSQESALNMPLSESISKALGDSKKTALVFATHKFMGQKELSEMGIVYCQLPYAIHRVMGD